MYKESGIEMIGKKIIHINETSSTNDLAKDYIAKNTEPGTLIIAKKQTSGRGRMGSGWESPSGGNIYMSAIIYTENDFSSLLRLPLVVAYAASIAIESVTKIPVDIKWPNDLIINRKKLGGILIETMPAVNGSTAVIIGIGINVNTALFLPPLDEKATSLKIETQTEWDVNLLSQAVVTYLNECFSQNPHVIIKEYKKKCITINKVYTNPAAFNIIIEQHGCRRYACAYGLDNYGRLLVRLENGEENVISSGEVHIRGIYGYV